ncbi:MAG: hypothetical protein RI971_1045 [Chloroflexota bacterium]
MSEWLQHPSGRGIRLAGGRAAGRLLDPNGLPQAGFSIPTGCLGGSCGACEIDVNGKTIRACIATVPPSKSGALTVEFATDPYW